MGHVELRWTIEQNDGVNMLFVRWQEYGGPPVNLPSSTGFGSGLMRGLARDMGGVANLEFNVDGVVWTLDSKLTAITCDVGD